jgi:DNA-binding transcriptional LysR family regulator
MELELRHHRHALALSVHRQYRRAAEELGITQPSLTRSIQEVERRVGARLFHRGRGGVDATDAGRVYLERAKALLRHADDVARELQMLSGLAGAELRIGAGVYPSELFVADAVARLAVEHPSMQVLVFTAMVDRLVEMLRHREIDVLIGDARSVETIPGLRMRTLAWHRACLVTRASHPLAGRRGLAASEIFAHPFAMSTRVPPDLMTRILEGRSVGDGPPSPRRIPSILCDSTSVLRRIVAGSDTVALLSPALVEHEVARGELAVLDFTAPWLRRQFAVVELEERHSSPALGAFLPHLVECDGEAARAWPLDGDGPHRAAAPADL